MLVFPDHDKQVIRTEETPYSVLVPLVKELASILEGNCSVEELKQYKAMLSNAIAKKKNELFSNANVQMAGQMVSSSVRSNKKQKTHGTKHMAFRC